MARWGEERSVRRCVFAGSGCERGDSNSYGLSTTGS
jgi:hypothetical protein